MNIVMDISSEFIQLVRDGLVNLHDYAALETHPLASVFPLPPNWRGSRAEYLRHLLLGTVDKLNPPSQECSSASVACRPYLILHGRYVEGLSLQELQARLSLSARQLRREHARALRAVATMLWDQASQVSRPVGQGGVDRSTSWDHSFRAFEITQVPLNLVEMLRGMEKTLELRVQGEGARLSLLLPKELPPVIADRVVLRQIILSLLGYALDARSRGEMTLGTDVDADHVTLWIQFWVDDRFSQEELEACTSLEAARYWVQRLSARLEKTREVDGRKNLARLTLSLPRAGRATVMVVDDEGSAVRMFHRYLSQFSVRVVGVQDAEQVLPLARQLHPQVITLDIMMPTIDGWEILQSLQADPETQDIPVLVCSVWDEPELAASLGAAGFLKKPITRRDLLGELARLKVLGAPAGSSPAGSSGSA